MQIAANLKGSSEIPSAHGEPSTKHVWPASDAPYRIIHLEQPAHGRDLLMVEWAEYGDSSVFKVAFRMNHPKVIISVVNDLLLQMRKITKNATIDDIHQLLCEMGGAYGKPMHRLGEFEDEVVYLDIQPKHSTVRMTRFARVLPMVEKINARRR